eukprot:5602603-Ditylum_brightwellii.AAC.1
MNEHTNSTHTFGKHKGRHGHPLPSRRIPTTPTTYISNSPHERTPNRTKSKLGSTVKQQSRRTSN